MQTLERAENFIIYEENEKSKIIIIKIRKLNYEKNIKEKNQENLLLSIKCQKEKPDLLG